MKKLIKGLVAFGILIYLLTFLTPAVSATVNIPAATSDFYVNDFATVFSSDEKERLMDNAVKLSKEHDGIQVVVSTVESLDGNTVENYAVEMYNQYGIGKNDMGLLILLSTGDRQLRVEVGKAMEAYITDAKAGRFMDQYAIPALKENQFNEGLINLQEALIGEIISCIESDTASNAVSSPENHIDFLSILWILLPVFLVIALIICITILVKKIITKSKEKQNTIDNLKNQLAQRNATIDQMKTSAVRESEELQKQIRNLLEEKNSLLLECQELENELDILTDRYARVQTLFPTADGAVTAMIEEEIRKKDMAAAERVDKFISKIIALSASKDNVSDFAEAKRKYAELTDNQRQYVVSNIDMLDKKYCEALRLKQEYDRKLEEERNKKAANETATAITDIISHISRGKASNLNQLKKAKSLYNNLSSASLHYFDKSIADKLDTLYRQAKHDEEEEEEAECRRREEEEEYRRRMQNDSYSSFGSSSYFGGNSGGGSSFGGFGGSSGGGGASRGF